MICSLCEKEKPQVFYVRFRVGPIIDILPQQPDKPGMCQDCLEFCGKKLSKNRAYRNLGGGKLYAAPHPVTRPNVAEKFEESLL